MEKQIELSKISISSDERYHIYNGKPLYDKKFKKVMSFHPPGIAAAEDETGSYHINVAGAPLYNKRFVRTFGFYNGIATVVDESGWYHIDLTGTPIHSERFAWAGNFQEGLCTVRDHGDNYFHINENGKPAYKTKYRYAGDFKYGIAVVYDQNGVARHINRDGALINNKAFTELGVYHKGFAVARDEKGYFHIDKEGKPIYSERFAWVEPFYNGYAFVKTFEGPMGIIDEKGSWNHTVVFGDKNRHLREVMGDLVGFWKTQLTYSAVKLGIIRYLYEKEKSEIYELAKDLEINEDGAWRLCRALAVMNYIKIENNCASLDNKGLVLYENLLHAALMWGEEHYSAFSGLYWSITEGKSYFQEMYGTNFLDYIDHDKEKLAIYQRAMEEYAWIDYAKIPDVIDFSSHKILMDVGGGTGTLLYYVLKKYGNVQGVLLERPAVVEIIRKNVSTQDETWKRVKLVSGDFMKKIPYKVDGIILSRVIHDWDDYYAAQILSNVYNALKVDGKLFVIEIARSQTYDMDLGLTLDLNMLCVTGGRERTIDELYELIGSSEFRIVETKNIGLLSVIIAANKA